MTLGDFEDFAPTFPVYIPCRVSVEAEPEVLLIGMGDGNGHQAAPCVPLFSDHEQCLIFGKDCLFPYVHCSGERSISCEFAGDSDETRRRNGSARSPISHKARDGFPISRAIQLLGRATDPPEET